MSVAPTGQVINVADHNPGSISDLFIFQHNVDFHNQAFNKYGDNKDIVKKIMSTKSLSNRAVLMDKGCQSAQKKVQFNHPQEETTCQNSLIGG